MRCWSTPLLGCWVITSLLWLLLSFELSSQASARVSLDRFFWLPSVPLGPAPLAPALGIWSLAVAPDWCCCMLVLNCCCCCSDTSGTANTTDAADVDSVGDLRVGPAQFRRVRSLSAGWLIVGASCALAVVCPNALLSLSLPL